MMCEIKITVKFYSKHSFYFIWSEKILFISIEIQKEKRICVYLFQDFNEFRILLMRMKKGPQNDNLGFLVRFHFLLNFIKFSKFSFKGN
jgi:hypothetical protein